MAILLIVCKYGNISCESAVWPVACWTYILVIRSLWPTILCWLTCELRPVHTFYVNSRRLLYIYAKYIFKFWFWPGRSLSLNQWYLSLGYVGTICLEVDRMWLSDQYPAWWAMVDPVKNRILHSVTMYLIQSGHVLSESTSLPLAPFIYASCGSAHQQKGPVLR